MELNMREQLLDVLAFGAHPDDVELSMGGTIISFVQKGLKVGIIDLTRGELSSRGNLATRKKETDKASEILAIHFRDNLKLKDGDIEINHESIRRVVESIRRLKPKIVFAPYFKDRHPDHEAAAQLIKKSIFYSGLKKYKTRNSLEPFRPRKVFYFMQTYPFEPTFIYDISPFFEQKMKAVLAYSSQFYNPNNTESETFISTPEFLNYLKSRSEYFGFFIGKQYGEPFYCEEKIEFDFSTYLKDE